MTAFTPEQEARVREIIAEALLGIERQRMERILSYREGDIEYGVSRAADRLSEAPYQACYRAEEGNS